ncbi:MAG: AraC family transcriptional regulator [Chthoniobacterales bacterium]
MKKVTPPLEKPHGPIDRIRSGEMSFPCGDRCYRARGTDDWLLLFTIHGTGVVATGEVRKKLNPGTVALYHPNTPQDYYTDPETGHWHCAWSHFHPLNHWHPWLQWPAVAKGLYMLNIGNDFTSSQVVTALSESFRFFAQQLPESNDLAINALERAIIWINTSNQAQRLDERIRKAVNMLTEHAGQPLSVDTIARECGLSASRFSYLFRKQVGTSPQLYMEKLKLQRAAQMLRHSETPIGEIALEVGYPNIFYFSTRFKKIMGKSPLDYRRSLE